MGTLDEMEKNGIYNSLNQYIPSNTFRTSIEAQVLQTLRAAISQGAFYPGQEINEEAIAKDLGISRMPVRQAVTALEVEGLVTKVPRKGIFVTRLDEHDIEEIYTTRVALEEVAIKAAVARYTEADFRKLEENIDNTPAEMDSYPRFLEIDKTFHYLLYAPSGWQRVTKLILQLRNNTGTYRILCGTFSKERMMKSLGDHKAILAACMERDVEKASALLKNHTLSTAPNPKEVRTFNESISND